MRQILAALFLLCLTGSAFAEDAVPSASTAESGVRLKDLCEIHGVRANQLHGIGIVVGLTGTGDKTPATVRMLRQLLTTKHLSFSDADLKAQNVAMVAITADLPAYARNGSRLPAQVACIGDANSLRGGILLQTALVAADGKIYAAAQGPVSIGGFGSAGPTPLGATGTDHKNLETVAALTPGALVEREVPVRLLIGDRLRLVLRDPDFTTASRVAQRLSAEFGADRISAEDASTVAVLFPPRIPEGELVAAVARLHELRVEPDVKARIVINARTGTVVAGRDVSVSPVAVSHGGLSLRIQPKQVAIPDPSAPNGRRDAIAWIDPATRLAQPAPLGPLVPGTFSSLRGASVDDIATALNALGARPRDLVAIFEALQRAGALHAELVVM